MKSDYRIIVRSTEERTTVRKQSGLWIITAPTARDAAEKILEVMEVNQ